MSNLRKFLYEEMARVREELHEAEDALQMWETIDPSIEIKYHESVAKLNLICDIICICKARGRY